MTPRVPGAVRAVLAWAGATDVGRRERNEDAHAAEIRLDPASGAGRGLFVVCDGMGGHAGGDTASALAVAALRRELAWVLEGAWPAAETVAERARAAVAAANHAIFDLNERLGARGRDRAGTTLAMLLVADGEAHVGHVGDSRVYAVTGRATTLLTLDHTVANWEIRRGAVPEVARRRPDARHLMQALGPFGSERVQLELQRRRVVEPTLFVLCSDGVSDGEAVEREAARLLRPLLAPGADLQAGGRALVAAARQADGRDNMTAVLVRVDPDG